MYQITNQRYSTRGMVCKKLVTVALASIALLHINYAIADSRTIHTGFDSSGTQFEKIRSQQLAIGVSSDQVWLSGDFDGDTYDDLITISGDRGRAKVVLHHSDSVYLTTRTPQILNAGFWSSQRWLVGDFNRDNFDDLALIYSYKGMATAWIYTSDGSRFTRTSTQRLGAKFWNEQRWETGDFDADRRDDLVLIYGYKGVATAWIFSSDGSEFTKPKQQRLGVNFGNKQRWETGNFDGDTIDGDTIGRDDLLLIEPFGNNTVATTFISNGSEFGNGSSGFLDAGFWDTQRWEVGEVTGDTKDDLVLIYGHSPEGATAWTYASTGTGFSRVVRQRLNTPFRNNQRWLVTNLDGDDYDGLALVYADNF